MSAERFIDSLLEADRSGDVSSFIRERAQALAGEVEPITFIVSGAINRTSYKYIHPESVIKHNASGYRLDDDQVGDLFASSVLEVLSGDESSSPGETVLLAAQLALIEYFGLPHPDAKKRRKQLLPGWPRRGRTRSIAELSQGGAAMCLEFSATSHNLLLIGGVPSALLTCMMQMDGQKPTGHALQLVKLEDACLLFDGTNPSVARKGNTVTLTPTTKPVDAAAFLNGSAAVEAELSSSVDDAEPIKQPVRYWHKPGYPATFEGLASLSFAQRAWVSDLGRETYFNFAIEDALVQLRASELGAEASS